MYSGQCHCGNVTLTIRRLTNVATKCNCSLCRRYAALWGYLTEPEVNIAVGKYELKSYEHGDKCISFQHCDRAAVNYNMFSGDLIEAIQIRYFDGADSWEYIQT